MNNIQIGGRHVDNRRVIPTSFTVDREMERKLEERKRITGMNKSEQARRALELYFMVLERHGTVYMDETDIFKSLGLL